MVSNSQSQSMQTLSKTSSGDPLRKASSRDRLKNSRSCGRVSQQTDLDADRDITGFSADGRQESEETWKLVMCAADRCLFCLFMLTSFIGLLLVVIAKTM